jgi:hypothetical protein
MTVLNSLMVNMPMSMLYLWTFLTRIHAALSGFPAQLQGRIKVKSQRNFDLDVSFLPFLRRLSRDCHSSSLLVVSLVSVAQSRLRDAINDIQQEVHPLLQNSDPSCAVILEFAFMSQEISILDPQQAIMCLLPFILAPIQDRTDFDTSTSIFSGLLEILQLLVTGVQPFSIQSARNVTKMHCDRLTREIDESTNNLWLKDQRLAKLGAEGLQELLFRKQWELALYASGKMSRWWIIVGKSS